MINLDDKQTLLNTLGGDSVVVSVDSLYKQLEQSFNEVQQVQFPEDYKNAKNILVCGMGGSRFPALILQHLFKEQITVPYVITDDYNITGFVNEDTLVVLSSYSGTTEEVIACGEKALAAGAKVCGICAGGRIAEMLKEAGKPVYVFDPVHNPSGQPRIGFGYSVGGHLGLLIKLGFVQNVTAQEVESAIHNLPNLAKGWMIDSPKAQNEVKQLAEKLQEKYPYYLVAEFLTGVGNAVQNQTNETAKSISSYRVVPELNHHMMEGLKFPTAHKDMAVFVLFYSHLYSDKLQKRFHITKDVVEQNKTATVWHELKGATKIEQTFELMALGSYLSMYMAALYEQDPNAIPYVDYFKDQLKKMG